MSQRTLPDEFEVDFFPLGESVTATTVPSGKVTVQFCEVCEEHTHWRIEASSSRCTMHNPLRRPNSN